MNFFNQLEWSHWKQLTLEDKQLLFRQILMYYVSPFVKVSDVTLVDYELAGIKCTTFECQLDNEEFVFIPGNKEAILGWDLGIQGLPIQEVVYEQELAEESEIFLQFKEIYGFEILDDFNDYVNDFTTPLRKVAVAPMLVQKYALPVGTSFVGSYHTVTANFEGNEIAAAPFLSEIKHQLSPKLSLEESLTWEFPRSLKKDNAYYLEMSSNEDTYSVYKHSADTHQELLKEIHAKGFDLLTEDQWEYAVGGGTRRIFRWGNELLSDQSPWAKSVREKKEGPNMFGLIIDTSKTRFELTRDPSVLKLDIIEDSGCPIIDCLPLSSYYQSGIMIQGESPLAPEEFLYRKTISIEMTQ